METYIVIVGFVLTIAFLHLWATAPDRSPAERLYDDLHGDD